MSMASSFPSTEEPEEASEDIEAPYVPSTLEDLMKLSLLRDRDGDLGLVEGFSVGLAVLADDGVNKKLESLNLECH